MSGFFSNIRWCFSAACKLTTIPSGLVDTDETVVGGLTRRLRDFGLAPVTLWAAEHANIIYNRRFESMQIVGVYAAEIGSADIRLDPDEHTESGWYSFEDALRLVHYRGLKDGIRSVQEYITGPERPARELRLL
jgi:hypothetical protein